MEPWRGPAQNHTSFFKFITSRLFLLPFYNQNADRSAPGFLVHLKRWTRFFETFPVGRNRSIEFWTGISEILVEWIAPTVTSGTAAPSAMKARTSALHFSVFKISSCFHETTYTPPCGLCWDLHELREQLFYPICEFFSASEGSFRFSLRDINLTLRLLSTITHVIWHDSVFCVCCEF